MTDQETSPEATSPYGRGFVAACLVLGAILLCGGALVVTDLATSPGTPAAGSDAAGAEPGDGRADATGWPADPADGRADDPAAQGDSGTADPGSTGVNAARPASPDPAASDPASANSSGAGDPGRSACGLADGDQVVPTEAPAVDGWEVSRRVVVPRSAAHGPAEVDPDGFRRCFAHSPTGALFAAYNAVAAVGDQRQAVPTAGKLMLPGPDTDSLLRELRKQRPSSSRDEATQLAGFRILDATRDRVTVLLALPVQSEYMSANLTLVWHRGDWRVVPPRPGRPFGAPFAQHRDLDDFVTWRGI
ncbi:hypothetical protein Kfla_0136 [Kribbella flavida DSM 17836]|uniref:DUF8175 domain-containing protein n=1 Tax=Kribbella flavida (strain DSM 17836 / JCM 10339 / NBRC 14399) TaxID=479435 RepID=D2PRT5_KRIFD|nr:hypothetical protein [Kribbella flavida]ADB29265.1 hypothetical protein Kfla_0136 [Kribbella flavida DSM 17836]